MIKQIFRAMKQGMKIKSRSPFSREEIILHLLLAIAVELMKSLVLLFVARL